MAKQEILIWEAWNKKTVKFEHNHIEDGWGTHSTPKANCPEQEKAWKGQEWRATEAYLVDNVVVEVEA